MLIIAVGENPYGYYTLLRWVICGVAAYTAVSFSNQTKQGWAWTFGILALLFNPIVPVDLDRSTWAFVDLASAALVGFSIKLLPREGNGSLEKN